MSFGEKINAILSFWHQGDFPFIGVKSCQHRSLVFQCAAFLSVADKVDEVPPSQKNTRDNSSADMRVATIKPRPSSRCLVTPTDFNVIPAFYHITTVFESVLNHILLIIHYIGHINTITVDVSQTTYSLYCIDHIE